MRKKNPQKMATRDSTPKVTPTQKQIEAGILKSSLQFLWQPIETWQYEQDRSDNLKDIITKLKALFFIE